MMRRLALACLGLALAFAGSTQLFAATPESSAALRATDYVRTLQNPDGGFAGFSPSSAAGSTGDAIFALSSAGIDAKTVTNAGVGPDDYLATQAAAFSASAPGSAAKLVLAVAAMNLDATNFGSINPLAVMESNYNTLTGQFGSDVFAQSLFMLAEDSLDRPVPALSVTYLKSLQMGDGAWEYCCAFGTDMNTTALAVRALIAGGVAPSDPAITQALGYFALNQSADGGFPYCCGFDPDPNSTGIVIQALVAAGADVGPGGAWDKGAGATPLAYVVAEQNPTTGAIQYFGNDDAFATYQALPGLMLSAFPERSDPDGDALIYAADNCPSVANASQLNTDAAPAPNGPMLVGDDVTLVMSDAQGDACDADDDNDGLSNVAEASGASCGAIVTNPLLVDTDGDHLTDGWECTHGSSPVNAASKALGTGSADVDGDHLPDVWEARGYSASGSKLDSDGDGCADLVEIASVDANKTVGDPDRLAVARRTFGIWGPDAAQDYVLDISKNGTVDDLDRLFVARAALLPGWLPKSCP